MKKYYSILIAMFAMGLFASTASAAAAKPAFPSWSLQINTTKRFTVLTAFGGAAVLDNETGLVWEKTPGASLFTWSNAQVHCNQLTTGGRLGWRLPTIQELASLVDPNNPGGNPDLPPGHPFTNVQSSDYWSASTSANGASVAWAVNFNVGVVGHDDRGGSDSVWCARWASHGRVSVS